MKKTIYKLILVMIVLFNTGCSEDFLDRESLSSLADDNFWTTESDATLGLIGAYSALQSKWIYDSNPYEGGSVRWDFMSDNGYTTWQWMAGGDITQGIHTAESWMVNDTWKALYVGIARANTVIQKVGAMDAANIDLKGFTKRFYKKLTGSEIQPVLETIAYAVQETSCWVELTTLLIPGENDDPKEIKALCRWVLDTCGSDVPLHFTPIFACNQRPQRRLKPFCGPARSPWPVVCGMYMLEISSILRRNQVTVPVVVPG